MYHKSCIIDHRLPRGLRRRFVAARLQRSCARIPPKACLSVCCECCVLSGRGLCDWLITRPEESYRLYCVVVCDLEISWMRRPWPNWGLSRQKQTYIPNWFLANRTNRSIVHTECSCSENTCWSHIWCTCSETGTCTRLLESIQFPYPFILVVVSSLVLMFSYRGLWVQICLLRVQLVAEVMHYTETCLL